MTIRIFIYIAALAIFFASIVAAGYLTTALMDYDPNLAAWTGAGIAIAGAIITAMVGAIVPE